MACGRLRSTGGHGRVLHSAVKSGKRRLARWVPVPRTTMGRTFAYADRGSHCSRMPCRILRASANFGLPPAQRPRVCRRAKCGRHQTLVGPHQVHSRIRQRFVIRQRRYAQEGFYARKAVKAAVCFSEAGPIVEALEKARDLTVGHFVGMRSAKPTKSSIALRRCSVHPLRSTAVRSGSSRSRD
jgi:hypothetical protein